MKKILKFAVALTAVIALMSPAQAATPKLPIPGCTNANPVQSTPKTVKQPMQAAKVLPKKLTLVTNCGNIEIALNSKAPLTVTSLATLANAKYFDKTYCHRLTTAGLYVLQCGDPTFTGSGTPTGWKGYADENLPKEGPKNYPAGTVAMANSGPGTNGSQFFLVYADTQLGPNYTIWGKITKGLPMIQKIAATKAFVVQNNAQYYAEDGYPIQTVEIVKASAK